MRTVTPDRYSRFREVIRRANGQRGPDRPGEHRTGRAGVPEPASGALHRARRHRGCRRGQALPETPAKVDGLAQEEAATEARHDALSGGRL